MTTPLTPETIARLRELPSRILNAGGNDHDHLARMAEGKLELDCSPLTAYRAGYRDGLTEAAGLALGVPALLDEVERHQWHRLADKKPPDGEKVMLYRPTSYGTAEVYHNVTECQYERLDNEWDHANWHGPIPAQPDDLWTRLPHPPAHLLKASNP